MLRSVLAGIRQGLLGGLAALALGVGLNVLFVETASAQHKMKADDMELAIDDPKVVDFGREKYAQRCSFCHGGGAKGGKGPCLTCGRFRYTGNTNIEIYSLIAGGVSNRSLGGTMGAFGTTMSMEEIQAVITFMRSEERRRIAEGEIENPYQQ
jgi:mono/diheme cytochrome c family protein